MEKAFQLAAVVLLFGTLTVAATTDVLRRKIYNWLTVPAIAFGLALSFGAGGLDGSAHSFGFWNHLLGSVVGLLIFFVAYWVGGMGGGEVKLMAAVGAIMGFPFIVGATVWSGLVGAAMAMWVLVWRGQLLGGLRRSARYALSLRPAQLPAEDPLKVKIPYGVAIAFGTLWAWFLTVLPA